MLIFTGIASTRKTKGKKFANTTKATYQSTLLRGCRRENTVQMRTINFSIFKMDN